MVNILFTMRDIIHLLQIMLNIQPIFNVLVVVRLIRKMPILGRKIDIHIIHTGQVLSVKMEEKAFNVRSSRHLTTPHWTEEQEYKVKKSSVEQVDRINICS